MTLRAVLSLAPFLYCSACASHGGSTADDPATCTAIGPAPSPSLPHVSATGAKATAIEQALDALFAAQTPALSPGQTYSVSTLDCGDVDPPEPMAVSFVSCTLQVQIGGSVTPLTATQPSTLLQNLFDALTAAGSTTCDQGAGPHVVLRNMTVSGSGVEYDDVAQYQGFPAPNVVVHGADAKNLIDAFTAAGIDDCDPTRYVFLICSSVTGPLTCSYQWMPLEKVGSAEALAECMGGGATVPGGGGLASAPSLALWQAVLTAATDSGFQPQSGTIAQTTVVNARFFAWDGTKLGFSLQLGNATPPGDAAAP